LAKLSNGRHRLALDLTAFETALARLREGMDIYAQDTSNTPIRDGLIQRFETTYELARKMLKRAMEAASPTPEAYDRMSFAELIRSGNEQGLLRGDWPLWRKFRDMRARSSHTYAKKWRWTLLQESPNSWPKQFFCVTKCNAGNHDRFHFIGDKPGTTGDRIGYIAPPAAGGRIRVGFRIAGERDRQAIFRSGFAGGCRRRPDFRANGGIGGSF
jgi:nucleotidyltransferase substrate binding protein (TIGR01987 family)